MKTMVLTGLATEQSFDNGGEAMYFLVFNHGELRIPTSETAAEEVVKAMFGSDEGAVEHEPDQPIDYNGHHSEPPSYDDDGVESI